MPKNNHIRIRWAIFALLVAGGLGLGWWIVATRGDIAELDARLVAARARQAKVQALLQQIKTRPSSALANATTPAAKDGKKAKPATAARDPGPLSFYDFARDDPKLMNLWIAFKRSDYRQLFGPLLEQLKLSGAQREKFADILSAQVARDTDIGFAARVQGLEPGDPVIKKLYADSQQQQDRELAAFLGDAGFQTYKEYERTLAVRGYVDGLAVQVAESDPLSAAQAEQLAQALIAHSSPRANDEGRHADPASVDWPAVDQEAERFLTPSQLAAWKLGLTSNSFGGSRADQELKKAYETAKAKK